MAQNRHHLLKCICKVYCHLWLR